MRNRWCVFRMRRDLKWHGYEPNGEVRSREAEQHRRRDRVELPDPKVHAMVHIVVENQLAANDDSVVRALARPMNAGLPRPEAIHPVGSAGAEHLFELLKGNDKGIDTPEGAHARYCTSIECLTAASWREGHDR